MAGRYERVESVEPIEMRGLLVQPQQASRVVRLERGNVGLDGAESAGRGSGVAPRRPHVGEDVQFGEHLHKSGELDGAPHAHVARGHDSHHVAVSRDWHVPLAANALLVGLEDVGVRVNNVVRELFDVVGNGNP